MKEIVLSTITYPVKGNKKVEISSISLVKVNNEEYLDVVFKLNSEMTSLKVVIATFDKEEKQLSKEEVEIKKEQLNNVQNIFKYRYKANTLTSYGGVYISSFIDQNLDTSYDLGMYSFASKERIAYEARMAYEGNRVPNEYFEVARHVEVNNVEEVKTAEIVAEDPQKNKAFMIATIVLFAVAMVLVAVYFIALIMNKGLGFDY